MKKKRLFIIISILLVVIIVLGVMFFVIRNNNKNVKKENEQQVSNVDNENKVDIDAESPEEPELFEIGYGSEVEKIGYKNAANLLSHFINSYNQKDGDGVVAVMDLVALYIYNRSRDDNISFDDKYVEVLSNPAEYEELMLLEYSMKNEEDALIENISKTDVELTLIDNTEIEMVSKYLAKMTAKIRTVSESEGIDQEDTLEFLLINKFDSYYILNFYPI